MGSDTPNPAALPGDALEPLLAELDYKLRGEGAASDWARGAILALRNRLRAAETRAREADELREAAERELADPRRVLLHETECVATKEEIAEAAQREEAAFRAGLARGRIQHPSDDDGGDLAWCSYRAAKDDATASLDGYRNAFLDGLQQRLRTASNGPAVTTNDACADAHDAIRDLRARVVEAERERDLLRQWLMDANASIKQKDRALIAAQSALDAADSAAAAIREEMRAHGAREVEAALRFAHERSSDLWRIDEVIACYRAQRQQQPAASLGIPADILAAQPEHPSCHDAKRHLSQQQPAVDAKEKEARCAACGNAILPDVCHCGTDWKHHNQFMDGHPFVPMGCDCFRAEKPAADAKEGAHGP